MARADSAAHRRWQVSGSLLRASRFEPCAAAAAADTRFAGLSGPARTDQDIQAGDAVQRRGRGAQVKGLMTTTADDGILAELGEFVAAAACERLPEPIVHQAKTCLLY